MGQSRILHRTGYSLLYRSDGRRLKNRGSERRVPLHPELVRAGFLDYVTARRRNGDGLLFPELRADAHGTRTRMWGKMFSVVKNGTREGRAVRLAVDL